MRVYLMLSGVVEDFGMKWTWFFRGLALIVVMVLIFAWKGNAATKQPIPPPTEDLPLATSSGSATAVFAGGCFWGTQTVFERVKGVLGTTAGYPGGSGSTATYDQVTTETTGHAES